MSRITILLCCTMLLVLQQASAAPGFRVQENPRNVEVAEFPMRHIGFKVRPRLRRGFFGRRTKIPLPLPVDNERRPIFNAITKSTSPSPRV